LFHLQSTTGPHITARNLWLHFQVLLWTFHPWPPKDCVDANAGCSHPYLLVQPLLKVLPLLIEVACCPTTMSQVVPLFQMAQFVAAAAEIVSCVQLCTCHLLAKGSAMKNMCATQAREACKMLECNGTYKVTPEHASKISPDSVLKSSYWVPCTTASCSNFFCFLHRG